MKKKLILAFFILVLSVSVFAAAPSFSSLNRAVNSGNVTLLQRYINQGADLNGTNSDGNTVLFTELYKDYDASERIVQILIDAGLDPNIGSYYDYTALHYSVAYCPTEVTLALLESPDIIVEIENDYGETPLLLEVYKDYDASYEVVEKLIELGADPNNDASGVSPLEHAQKYCSTEIIELLGGSAEETNEVLYEVTIPSWAHGEWTGENEDGPFTVNIAENDLIFTQFDGEEMSVLDLLNQELGSYQSYLKGVELIIDETENYYEVKFDILGIYNITFLSLNKTNNPNSIILVFAEGERLTLSRKNSNTNRNATSTTTPTSTTNASSGSNMIFPTWTHGSWGGTYNGQKSILTISSNDIIVKTDGEEFSVFKSVEEELGAMRYSIVGKESGDSYTVTMTVFGYTTPVVTLTKGPNSRSMYITSATGSRTLLTKQ